MTEEEKTEETKIVPLEVVDVTPKKEKTDYTEDQEYDDLFLTGDDIDEFEKDGS